MLQEMMRLYRRELIKACLGMGFYSFRQMRNHIRFYEKSLYKMELNLYS